ncbi:MAG: hypothetical protein ACFE9L_18900 [Candidatus Hodarchaeota archaeon]
MLDNKVRVITNESKFKIQLDLNELDLITLSHQDPVRFEAEIPGLGKVHIDVKKVGEQNSKTQN